MYVSTQAQALAELQRSIDDPMADKPEESTAGSPDQPHATASEPDATPPAGTQRDNIQPDNVPSIGNDARQTQQTTGPAPAQPQSQANKTARSHSANRICKCWKRSPTPAARS